MINNEHLSKTSHLYSYKLSLEPHNTIVMKIDSLIKKNINHQVDIAISLREILENLETYKLSNIWFREKLEHKLQLKELFSKGDKKVFNDYIDEFYLEYLLKVRDLIQEQKQNVPEDEANKFDELFKIALDNAIFDMVDNDHCIHDKAADAFIQLTQHNPGKNLKIEFQPIISDNLLRKIKGNDQAKNNIAITALMAIGKSLPPPRPSTNRTTKNTKEMNEHEHKSLICSRLCTTINVLNLKTMPTLNTQNADFDKALEYFKYLSEGKITSPYISSEQAKLFANSIHKSGITPN